jgi:hypothetical protein
MNELVLWGYKSGDAIKNVFLMTLSIKHYLVVNSGPVENTEMERKLTEKWHRISLMMMI